MAECVDCKRPLRRPADYRCDQCAKQIEKTEAQRIEYETCMQSRVGIFLNA